VDSGVRFGGWGGAEDGAAIGFGATASERLAFQGDLVRPVHDAIKDGIGHGGLAEPFVPRRQWQLAGDGRARCDAVVQQFQQVTALVRRDRCESEVVQDDQVQSLATISAHWPGRCPSINGEH
jgi:hypothetical protein